MSISIQETRDELLQCENNRPYFDFADQIHLCKVVKCYDGDTIHCIFKHDGDYYKFKIRMYAYDTAEMRPSRSIPQNIREKEISKAKEAKKRLEELILNKIVYLYCKGYDKYGRILGVIKIDENDEKSVNDIMVEEEHGVPYYGGTKKKIV